MSDLTTYHAMGDQHDMSRREGSPGGQQPGYTPSPYGQPGAPPAQGQHGMLSPPGSTQAHASPQPQGYFPPQGAQHPLSGGGMPGLTSHMGAMALGGPGPPLRAGKKKNRHAYHSLEQAAGSSQAYNGVPQGAAANTQFLDQPGQRPHPFAGQQVTPAMNQFPASPSGSVYQGPKSAPLPGATMDVSSSQGRVDPEMVPSVPRSRDEPAKHYQSTFYQTVEQHLPPPSAVPFVSLDQGNSSPKHARLTLNNIPASSEALNLTALPLGLVLQPLAALSAGEEPVPVLDFGDRGPPRCARCRTYINPFMTFPGGGNKFVCNMCTFPNDVPSEYFAPTDPSGVRVDREQRPELRLGTVEFMVPKEYWAKEPVGLRHLFVIDVSQEAINRGFCEAFCDGVLRALYSDDEEQGEGEGRQPKRTIPEAARVGFVTFDRDVHFYNCHVCLGRNSSG